MRKLPYAMKDLFHLIKDVDCYWEFLPWVIRSETYDHDINIFTGKLTLSYKNIELSYQSRVLYHCNDNDASVKALAIDGPFKNLETIWLLTEKTDYTEVSFSVEFEFSNILYQKIFNHLFQDMAENMMDAFEKRAASIDQNLGNTARSF